MVLSISMMCQPSFLSLMGSSKIYLKKKKKHSLPNEAKTATSPDEMDTLPVDSLQSELEAELYKQLEHMIDVDEVKGSKSQEVSDPGHRRQADKEGLLMRLENNLVAYKIFGILS